MTPELRRIRLALIMVSVFFFGVLPVLALIEAANQPQPEVIEVAALAAPVNPEPVEVPAGTMKAVMDKMWGEGMKVCALVRECIVTVTGVNLALRYEQIKAAQDLAQVWTRGLSNLCVASVAYEGPDRKTQQFGMGCTLAAMTVFTGKLASGEIVLKVPAVATQPPWSGMAAQANGNKR